MSDLLTAARQALEALEKCAVTIDWEWGDCRYLEEMRKTGEYTDATTPAITALRQAIEQVEQQEPVAWRYRMPVEDGHWVWNYSAYIDDPKDPRCEPLYTTLPQRKPLTDEEINRVPWVHLSNTSFAEQLRCFARAIERAHGIGGGE